MAELAAAGHPNREIAQMLFVTLRTVEAHLSASYRKLGIHGRAQLAPTLDLDATDGNHEVTVETTHTRS